jgi:hypothetical protein
MSVTKYFSDGFFHSYIIFEGNERELFPVYRHRALKYLPKMYGGDEGYIADTDINFLIKEDKLFETLIERNFWDTVSCSTHKLKSTAHFVVCENEKDSKNNKTIISGRIVPYSENYGFPMEDKLNHEKPLFDWLAYFRSELNKSDIGINFNDFVEIGRLCRTEKSSVNSITTLLLAFKTLHKFLEEINVKNYVCAAVDYAGKRYASLYEGMGLSKIAQYDVETVIKLETEDNSLKLTKKTMKYWALHMNIPIVQERISKKEFGIKKKESDALLNERILRFVTPYLFNNQNLFIRN